MLNIVLFWLLIIAPFKHEFYVGLTEVEHNSKSQTLEITVKIFRDDMEKAIEAKSGINLQLGTQREHAQADSLLYNYLSGKLEISVDGQKRKLRWIGKEADFDALWMYVEIEAVQYLKQIAIRNTLLFETFYDQSHIIKVNYDNEKEAGVVNRNKDRIEFRF
jgi:hypothetical protein